MSTGVALPAGEHWARDLTGSEIFNFYTGGFGDEPLSGEAVWLHCGTASSAALPDVWLGQCLVSGALFGSDSTSSGAQEREELPDTQRLVRELRRRSGLTWSDLARIFGVGRRALHFWANGASLADHNADRLRRVVEVVRQLDQGDPKRTKERLKSPGADGRAVVDLLADERFGAALASEAPAGDPSHPRRVRKRPPRMSAEIRRQRRDFAPEELLGAAPSDEYHNGRFVASFSLTAAGD